MASGSVAQSRIVAWLIDVLLVIGVGTVMGRLGGLAGLGYWLFRDGCFRGQSVGKRLMGLKVIGGERGRSPWLTSLIRNVLWVIPVVNLVAGLTGLYYLFQDTRGRHWGDRLADSRVVRV